MKTVIVYILVHYGNIKKVVDKFKCYGFDVLSKRLAALKKADQMRLTLRRYNALQSRGAKLWI